MWLPLSPIIDLLGTFILQFHLFITTLISSAVISNLSNHQPSSGSCVTPVLGFIHLNWISHSLHTFLLLVSSSFLKISPISSSHLCFYPGTFELIVDAAQENISLFLKTEQKKWWNGVLEAANVATFTLIWVLQRLDPSACCKQHDTTNMCFVDKLSVFVEDKNRATTFMFYMMISFHLHLDNCRHEADTCRVTAKCQDLCGG